MKRSMKRAWLDALRGKGEKVYTQCKGKLHTVEGYCCLGVKADVEGVAWEPIGNRTFAMLGLTWPETMMLSGDHLGGLEDLSLTLPIDSRLTAIASGATLPAQDALSRMNDSGFTFDEIADFIEANIPEEDG